MFPARWMPDNNLNDGALCGHHQELDHGIILIFNKECHNEAGCQSKTAADIKKKSSQAR